VGDVRTSSSPTSPHGRRRARDSSRPGRRAGSLRASKNTTTCAGASIDALAPGELIRQKIGASKLRGSHKQRGGRCKANLDTRSIRRAGPRNRRIKRKPSIGAAQNESGARAAGLQRGCAHRRGGSAQGAPRRRRPARARRNTRPSRRDANRQRGAKRDSRLSDELAEKLGQRPSRSGSRTTSMSRDADA